MSNFKLANSKGTTGNRQEDFPLLSSSELHIWQVSCYNVPDLLERCMSTLSEDELAKVSFFEFEQVKDSYVISQGTLRMLLAGYLDIPPTAIKIDRRRKGKPYSIDDPGLYFNMSNSGKLAVFAFSRDSEVGIDIEQIRHLPDLDDMIIKNFTSREVRYINAKTNERTIRFFRFWTVKESYLKAIGEGLRLPIDNLEFAIESEQIRHLSVKGVFEHEDWNFKEFSPAPDYVGTITYARNKPIIKQMEFK